MKCIRKMDLSINDNILLLDLNDNWVKNNFINLFCNEGILIYIDSLGSRHQEVIDIIILPHFYLFHLFNIRFWKTYACLSITLNRQYQIIKSKINILTWKGFQNICTSYLFFQFIYLYEKSDYFHKKWIWVEISCVSQQKRNKERAWE